MTGLLYDPKLKALIVADTSHVNIFSSIRASPVSNRKKDHRPSTELFFVASARGTIPGQIWRGTTKYSFYVCTRPKKYIFYVFIYFSRPRDGGLWGQRLRQRHQRNNLFCCDFQEGCDKGSRGSRPSWVRQLLNVSNVRAGGGKRPSTDATKFGNVLIWRESGGMINCITAWWREKHALIRLVAKLYFARWTTRTRKQRSWHLDQL